MVTGFVVRAHISSFSFSLLPLALLVLSFFSGSLSFPSGSLVGRSDEGSGS
jgi:hypothetical protein